MGEVGHKMERRQLMYRRLADDVILERDISVHMSDGIQLLVNIFRSPRSSRAPVLMSVTPYGKDVLPDRRMMLFMRLAGARFGHLDCSTWTGFEAPDPLFWVRAGYAVVQADVRGMHKSEGAASVLSDRDAQDYCELIEWVGDDASRSARRAAIPRGVRRARSFAVAAARSGVCPALSGCCDRDACS